MKCALFSEEDLRQIRARGLSPEELTVQINRFIAGMKKIKLVRPCRINDGIVKVQERELPNLVALHDQAAAAGRFMKFVPASGAASRMFESWYRLLTTEKCREAAEMAEMGRQLKKYPFFAEAKRIFQNRTGKETDLGDPQDLLAMMAMILSDEGLGYGRKPKALIKFHDYPSGSRTALEEQIWEGLGYLPDKFGHCRFHFTLPEESLGEGEKYLAYLKEKIEGQLPVRLSIGLSSQAPSTDTLAVDLDKKPFRDAEGRLVFRPGGHGSLLENLQALGADLVFIKNIDNVAREEFLPQITLFKKVLGGILVREEGIIFTLLSRLETEPGEGALAAAQEYLAHTLNVRLPDGFAGLPAAQKKAALIAALERPLRVCAVVKNEGEPGGGPFFVVDEDGRQSLQIVESFQVDTEDERQLGLWRAATHFNPVDLVCQMRNRKGTPYNLRDFVDDRYYSISKKSKDGKELLALERPGLWNGSMGFWHSIFVEVPLATFNPVKTVEDLLRPQHLGLGKE